MSTFPVCCCRSSILSRARCDFVLVRRGGLDGAAPPAPAAVPSVAMAWRARFSALRLRRRSNLLSRACSSSSFSSSSISLPQSLLTAALRFFRASSASADLRPDSSSSDDTISVRRLLRLTAPLRPSSELLGSFATFFVFFSVALSFRSSCARSSSSWSSSSSLPESIISGSESLMKDES